MDRSKNRQVDQKIRNDTVSHCITYKVSVGKLFVLQSWPFQKNYKTECDIFPTSWDLEVKFLEVRDDATVSLSVNLKRTDSEAIEPEACVRIRICDSKTCILFPTQLLEREKMSPGDVLQETVEMSLYQGLRLEDYESIAVHISIMISFCHTSSDSSSTISEGTSHSPEY